MKVSVKEMKIIIVSEFLTDYGDKCCYYDDELPRWQIECDLVNSCKDFDFSSHKDDEELEFTAWEFMDFIDKCLDDVYGYYFESIGEDIAYKEPEDDVYEDSDFEDEGPSLYDEIDKERKILNISVNHKISPEDVKYTIEKAHKKHPEITEEVFDDALDVIIAYLAENECENKILYDLNIRDNFNEH